MIIQTNTQKVISFNYTLRNKNGEQLDSSYDGPMSFLTGVGQIIPKLEETLLGMLVGQKKTLDLTADEAYGQKDSKMIMQVPKEELAHLEVQVGQFLQLNLGQQLKVVQITHIGETEVSLDGNHPLAGVDLQFDIELIDSRLATSEEISHGHAHGPGGHNH